LPSDCGMCITLSGTSRKTSTRWNVSQWSVWRNTQRGQLRPHCRTDGFIHLLKIFQHEFKQQFIECRYRLLGATYNRLYRAETDKDDCVVMVVGSCSHLGSGSNCNHCFCGFHRPRGRVDPYEVGCVVM